MRFIWDYDNLTHIARHGISLEEVEQVLGGVTMEVEAQDWHFEERFSEVGATATGRFLLIHSTSRNGAIRVVTAYDATRKSIEEYLKRR